MADERQWFSDSIVSCQDGLYLLALGILRNEEDAKDAVQEAVWRAYENLESLKNWDKFKPWIMKILTNVSYSMLRRRREQVSIDEELEIVSPEESVDANTRLTLWDAVQQLDLPYRDTVVLYYYEGLSVVEIGRVMEIRTETVKKRLSRAREKLRYLLGQTFEEVGL